MGGRGESRKNGGGLRDRREAPREVVNKVKDTGSEKEGKGDDGRIVRSRIGGSGFGRLSPGLRSGGVLAVTGEGQAKSKFNARQSESVLVFPNSFFSSSSVFPR